MSRLPIILALFSTIGVALGDIEDPRKDFLRAFESQDSEDLIWSEVDLNGDQVPEVLMSLSTMYNGNVGNIWVLYESLPDGTFTRRDELADGGVLEFHRKAAATRNLNNGAKEIVCYMPAGGGKGLIGAYQLGPEGMSQSLSEEIEPLGDDAPTYDRLFTDSGTQLVFSYENAGKLKNKYFPIRRLMESLSLVQWGLLAVGLLFLIFMGLGVLRGARSAVRAKGAK